MIDLDEGIDLRYPGTIRFTLEAHRTAVEANRTAIDAKGRLIERGATCLLTAAFLLGVAAYGIDGAGGALKHMMAVSKPALKKENPFRVGMIKASCLRPKDDGSSR